MIDMHTHSTFSDGTCTPAQLLEQAEQAGLTAIALTDHNSVDGLPDFFAAAQKCSVKAVGGTELSTLYQGTELHILGLFLTPACYAPIREITEAFRVRKAQSNRDLVKRLAESGYDISFEEVSGRAGPYINRAHIAAVLMEKGYFTRRQDAFDTVLNEKNGLYVPPQRPDAYRTIRTLRKMGALPVLAHPFLNLTQEELLAFLPEAVEAGLAGMEVLYPRYTPETTRQAAQIARQFGLLESGGSDYHGGNKPDIRLGTGTGSLCVPDALYDALWERALVCRQEAEK